MQEVASVLPAEQQNVRYSKKNPRPPEHKKMFFALLKTGLTPATASRRMGMSTSIGYAWAKAAAEEKAAKKAAKDAAKGVVVEVAKKPGRKPAAVVSAAPASLADIEKQLAKAKRAMGALEQAIRGMA